MFCRLLATTLGALILIGAISDSLSFSSGVAAAEEAAYPKAAPIPETFSTLGIPTDHILPMYSVNYTDPYYNLAASNESILTMYVVSDTGPHSNRVARNGRKSCEPYGGRTTCELSERFWIKGEYLLWWTKGANSPPLVTTSPDGTPITEAGVLGNATTEVLFPTGLLNSDARSGYRISAGLWRDACGRLAIEGDFWDLGAATTTFAASGNGSPILARPFYDTELDLQNSILVSFTDGASKNIKGTITVNSSDYFQSAGAWLRYNLKKSASNNCDCCDRRGYRLDMLAGYRHYRYNDSLSIHRVSVGGAQIATAIVDELDSFRTRNDFHGGELGLKAQVRRGRWSLDLLAKAAFGNTRQVINIAGETNVTIPPSTIITMPGGLLTGDNNLGQFTRNRFAVIPQFGAELGCELTCHWRAFAGYNFIYWANVQRAASQIDFNADTRISPPAGASPLPQLTNTDFWAQGINVGLECRY